MNLEICFTIDPIPLESCHEMTLLYPPARRTKSSAVGAPEVGEHDALEGTRACRARIRPPAELDGRKIVRTIGIARARFKIGMMNLGYNIRRLVQLERLAAVPA